MKLTLFTDNKMGEKNVETCIHKRLSIVPNKWPNNNDIVMLYIS